MEWGKKLDSDIFEIRSKVSSNIQRALYFMLLMTALSLRIDLLRKRKRPLLLKYSTLKLWKKNLRRTTMTTIKFDEFLNEESKTMTSNLTIWLKELS